MIVSRIVGFGMVVGILVSASACTVSVKTKTRFVGGNGNVSVADTTDWAGEPISINIQGVGASTGGVSVTSDPAATKVTAVASMLALADADDKASADLSIQEATASFQITRGADGTINVVCNHGGSHGSSDAGGSGCERVDVTIPAGSATLPLTVKALGGNGYMKINMASSTLKNLAVNSANGDTTASFPATLGASVGIVSELGDINCTVSPSTWSADEVIAGSNDSSYIGTITIPPDAKNGAGAGGRGTAGTGLASIKLTQANGISDITLQ